LPFLARLRGRSTLLELPRLGRVAKGLVRSSGSLGPGARERGSRRRNDRRELDARRRGIPPVRPAGGRAGPVTGTPAANAAEARITAAEVCQSDSGRTAGWKPKSLCSSSLSVVPSLARSLVRGGSEPQKRTGGPDTS